MIRATLIIAALLALALSTNPAPQPQTSILQDPPACDRGLCTK